MDGRKHDYLVKVIVIGDSGVGKTNLITRFCQNHFKDTYVATIGVDFKIKSLMIGEKKFKMQIWDTAGQQRFKNITQTYYKGAADSTSFTNIQRWMNQIESNAPQNVSKILVGTKQDLQSQRSVSFEEGQQLAKKHQIPFMQVSAKSGFNIKQCFEKLGDEIMKKYEQDGEGGAFRERSQTLNRGAADPQKKCAC